LTITKIISLIQENTVKIVIKDLYLERKIDYSSNAGMAEGYTKISLNIERPRGETHILKVPQCEILWDWRWVNGGRKMGHYFFLKKFAQDPEVKIENFAAKSLGFDVCVS
jgi:hypothetical protein